VYNSGAGVSWEASGSGIIEDDALENFSLLGLSGQWNDDSKEATPRTGSGQPAGWVTWCTTSPKAITSQAEETEEALGG
jgi:hypothetical protein